MNRLPIRRLPCHRNFPLPSFQSLRYTLAPILRWNSTKPPSPIPPVNPISPPQGATNKGAAGAKTTQRFERLLNRTPKFLRKWLQPIANKPISHITAFLILHEITAVVPLIGLTYVFHKAQWTPPVLPGEWLVQGVEKGAKLIRHYGIQVTGDQFVRLAFEFAAAYASVKLLIPVRIALSAWLTPWFARWTIVPLVGLFRRKKVRGASSTTTAVSDKGKDVNP